MLKEFVTLYVPNTLKRITVTNRSLNTLPTSLAETEPASIIHPFQIASSNHTATKNNVADATWMGSFPQITLFASCVLYESVLSLRGLAPTRKDSLRNNRGI